MAERLFYAQGYEQTSVQAIIDTVGVAKGTFYHYFDFQGGVVGCAGRALDREVMGSLQPILDDPALDAVAKFEQLVYHRSGSWKAENRAFLLEAMQVLYEDKNVLLRTKMQAEIIALATPLLARIIQQGTEEGRFTVVHVEETAEVVLAMSQAFSESTARMLLAGERGESGAGKAPAQGNGPRAQRRAGAGSPRGEHDVVQPGRYSRLVQVMGQQAANGSRRQAAGGRRQAAGRQQAAQGGSGSRRQASGSGFPQGG